jgi:hypothetical protein
MPGGPGTFASEAARLLLGLTFSTVASAASDADPTPPPVQMA